MKFTLAWLKEHLETAATLEEITFALTDLGLEVEGVTNPAARLAAFTVGEVLEACAASRTPTSSGSAGWRPPTARSRSSAAPRTRGAGIKVVVAAPGDYIPGIDTTIKVGKIRGVESHGMMLSEREMELSDAHEGIVELDPDAPVGARYIDVVPLRPGHRDRRHAEPPRRARRRRHRPRPRRPRPRPADHPRGRAGARRLPLPGRGLSRPRRGGRGLPALRRPADPRRDATARRRSGCRTGCAPSGSGRSRRWSTSPTSSPTTAAGRCTSSTPTSCTARSPCASPAPARRLARARRQGLRLRRLRDAGLRRQRPGGHRRRHGRPALGLHRGDHATSSSRRPGSTRCAPPAPAGGCASHSDARYRFERGVDPAFTPLGMELGTRHDPRSLRRRGLRGRDRRRGARRPPAATGCDPERVARLVGMEIARDRAGAHPDRARLRAGDAGGGARGRGAVLAARRAGRGRPRRGDRPHRLAEPARGPADGPRRPASPGRS